MIKTLLLFAVIFLALACSPKRPDYSLFERARPRSILILPPLNATASVDAANKYLSTVTFPVAERGYYVIPIAIAERMLRENGVVGAEEMRQVSRKKLRDIFGADALLDITIDQWGTRYFIIGSKTTVKITFHLFDLRDGQELWSYTGYADDDSGGGGSNLAAQLIGAATHALVSANTDSELPLARQVNNHFLMHKDVGLLPGPYWVEKPE